MNNSNNIKIITVDGLIGSGKTTFLPILRNYLLQHLNVCKNKNFKKSNDLEVDEYSESTFKIFIKIVYEPVDEWVNSGMLTKFYKDPHSNALEFQLYIFQTLFDTLHNKIEEINDNPPIKDDYFLNKNNNCEKKLQKRKSLPLISGNDELMIILCERSLYSSRYIFAQHLIDEGMLRNEEIEVLNIEFKNLVNKLPPIDLFIWLNNPVETCMKRINERNRSGESSVDQEYQMKLRDGHSNMYMQIILDHLNNKLSNKNKVISSKSNISLDFKSDELGINEIDFLNKIVKHVDTLLTHL